MKTTEQFNFNYLDLVTALGSLQTANPKNSMELTKEILGFFQSEHAEILIDKGSSKTTLNITPKPIKPLLKKFIATIYFFDGDECVFATVEEEIEAKDEKTAEDKANQNLKLGDWATVQLIGS